MWIKSEDAAAVDGEIESVSSFEEPFSGNENGDLDLAKNAKHALGAKTAQEAVVESPSAACLGAAQCHRLQSSLVTL
jgi:hypothetical protein